MQYTKLITASIALLFPFYIFAQAASPVGENSPQDEKKEEKTTENLVENERIRIQPKVDFEPFVSFGEKTTFDASKSIIIADEDTPNFSWKIFKHGEQIDTKFGKKLNYEFKSAGNYTIKLTISQGVKVDKPSAKFQVLVYEHQGVVFTDDPLSQIESIAAKEGLWLKKILLPKSDLPDPEREKDMIQAFRESLTVIQSAEIFVFESADSFPVFNFAEFYQTLESEQKFDLKDKIILLPKEGNLNREASLLQPAFEILQYPILLAQKESLSLAFQDLVPANFLETLDKQALMHKVINAETRPPKGLIFKRLLNYFSKNGIPLSVIYLLLSIPFITFLITFSRQVVGISTFGLISPLMLTLSFMVLGMKFGLIVFLLVLLVSYILRKFFESFDMSYIPKVALLTSFLALSFFILLALAIYFETSLNLTLTIFPMVILSTISEKFLNAQTSGGVLNALIAALETTIVSLICFWIIDAIWLQSMILAYPEIVFIPIIGIILLGKFTGLRLTEYFKFRSLLREDSQE